MISSVFGSSMVSLAIFLLHKIGAKSHHSQQSGNHMPLVELLIFWNSIVNDSPHLGRARIAPTLADNPRVNRTMKKRPFDALGVEGA
jgi:hypothetical protein